MVARRLVLGRLLRVFHRARRLGLWSEVKPLLRDRLTPGRTGPAQDGTPLPPLLFQMATAYWVSQAIYVAAKLGIADLLRDGQRSCVELAAATGSDPASLFRLMRSLASVGVFSHIRGDRFALSRLAEALQTDAPGSLRAMVITIGEIHYQACGNLLHSIQTGSPAFNNVFGASLFDYLKQNADAAHTFNEGMTNLSSMLAYAVLMAYDFSGISSIVDVGGGQGELVRRLLQFNPNMKGSVFDTASTIERVEQVDNDASAGRCTYLSGDFFNAVPQNADAYLLCGVIHDWDDGPAVRILRNCRRAMAEHGRVLIIDMVVPDTDATSFSKLLDLNMLVMNGGRERTKAEFGALLNAAGCTLSRVVPTLAPQSIIEAVPRWHSLHVDRIAEVERLNAS